MVRKKKVQLPKEEPKKPDKEKKPVLSERYKFHKWYKDVYCKDAAKMIANGELHHCDKHGMLGYETNTFMHEIQTVTGKIEFVGVKGLCPLCTVELPSAKEEYENR